MEMMMITKNYHAQLLTMGMMMAMISLPDCTEDNAEDEAEYEKADDDEKPNVWRCHLPLAAPF